LKSRILIFSRILIYLIFFVLVGCYYQLTINYLFFSPPKPTNFTRQVIDYTKDKLEPKILVGFSKRDITPSRHSWLAGYFPPHLSLDVNDKLWIKSLAFKDGNGNSFVIVSCDLIGLLPNEKKEIVKLVKTIDENAIFITTTHTHSGPDTIGYWGVPPFSGRDEKYIKFLRIQIAEVIDESVNNLKSGHVRFSKTILLNYTVGTENNDPDKTVSVIQAFLNSGKPVTLVNFAAHPNVIKSYSISADYIYYLEQKLNKLTGGETMFVAGAIGGVNPKNFNQNFARDFGEVLADKVYHSLSNSVTSNKIFIKRKDLKVTIPLENKRFIKALKVGMIPDFRKREKINLTFNYKGKLIPLSEGGYVEMHFSKISMGPIEIITAPGEVFPNIWTEVKPYMGGEINMLFGLTNGELGYFLKKEDFISGKHEYHVDMSIGKTAGYAARKVMLLLVK